MAEFSERLEYTVDRQSLIRRGFKDGDIDLAERFGRPHVALYSYVFDPKTRRNENAVQTPRGQGTLHQAFSDRCLVLLTRGKATQKYKGGKMWKAMESFHPDTVRPA